jgi:hypothetical protein
LTAITGESVPERLREWETGEDGLVSVLRPRFGTSRFGLWLASRIGKPWVRVRLDEVGSFTWNACDGTTTVAEIAGSLREAFGDRIEPANERLGTFLVSLERNGLIRWKDQDGAD